MTHIVVNFFYYFSAGQYTLYDMHTTHTHCRMQCHCTFRSTHWPSADRASHVCSFFVANPLCMSVCYTILSANILKRQLPNLSSTCSFMLVPMYVHCDCFELADRSISVYKIIFNVSLRMHCLFLYETYTHMCVSPFVFVLFEKKYVAGFYSCALVVFTTT